MHTENLKDILNEFPSQMRVPVEHLVNWIQTTVSREDFSELKLAIQNLTVMHAHTEEKMQTLSDTMSRLSESQEQTDKKMQTLSESQEKTERKMQALSESQEKTDKRIQTLSESTDKKFQALSDTVRELAETQKTGFKSLSDQIAALGSRWGIYNEGTFRATIHGILRDMEGIRIEEGDYGDRQVDVIIRNGEHIMLEITSRMHSKDIDKLYRSADDYHKRNGVMPKLMVATSYIGPKLMQKIMGLERPIEIFSYGPND